MLMGYQNVKSDERDELVALQERLQAKMKVCFST